MAILQSNIFMMLIDASSVSREQWGFYLAVSFTYLLIAFWIRIVLTDTVYLNLYGHMCEWEKVEYSKWMPKHISNLIPFYYLLDDHKTHRFVKKYSTINFVILSSIFIIITLLLCLHVFVKTWIIILFNVLMAIYVFGSHIVVLTAFDRKVKEYRRQIANEQKEQNN